MLSLSSKSRSKRGNSLVLVRQEAYATKTKLNKGPSLLFSVCKNELYSKGFPSTPLLVSTAGFMEAKCIHMDPAERRGGQGSPQVSGRHRRRMWLCSLTRLCWCGPSHHICQCNYSSSSLAGKSKLHARLKPWGRNSFLRKRPVWRPTRNRAVVPSPTFVFILAGVGSVIWVSIRSGGL